jgi:hypothetical protein
MTTHLTQTDAAQWVAGVLDLSTAMALETHVKACPACERLLAHEARLETQLLQAVAHAPAPRPGLRGLPRAALVALPLALAASLLLFASQTVSNAATALDGGTAAALDVTVVVPHYEHDHQVPPQALVSFEPAPL